MAQSAPSHMFARLVNVWRDLSFRSDVDDIVLEILGRFSLDRIYAETTADRQSYQRLIVTLLTQLNAIFYIQRLTLPPANDHFGARLGLLVSWEVAMRTFEMLLHTIVDGREGLWDRRLIIDKSLGQLLSFGLRFLVLHPGMGAGEDAYGQADRFARLHDLLEQVLDSFPGPQTVLLLACKDIAGQLASDPRAFANKPRQNLPNLASEMYPLSECMSPQSIMQLATQVETPENWVDGVFSLRDVAYFTSAASMQYTVNQETRDMDLHAASWRTRDAVFEALELLPLPAYVSKPHLASTFANVFSIALPETMSTYEWDEGEEEVNNIAYDALDMLCTRLSERQVLHRISDGAVTHSVSQVLDILTPSGSSSNRFGAPAGLYVVNCPHCHSFDSMQMRSYNVHFRRSPEEYITLPAQSTCLECREPISYAREISLFRRTWELLRHLETDTRASTIERHVSSHFQLRPLSRRGTDSLHSQTQSLHSPMSPTHANVTAVDFAIRQATSSASGQRQNTSSPTHYPESTKSQEQPSRPERLTSDTSVYTTSGSDNHPYHQYHHQQQSQQLHNHKPSVSYANTSSPVSSEPRHTISGWPSRRKSEAAPDKGKLSRWKFSLGSSRKSTQAAAGNNSGSGDSSSLSSAGPDPQKLEDIPLDGLFSVQKSSKGKRVVHTSVSTTSSLVLFWAQATLQIWDAATSPPSMVQAIFADNPCLLAAVGTSLVAYITGSREQRLTLRIVSLADPATSTVEYRMPSTHWCRSIAIDPIENYVAVGFDGAAVRFYKTRSMQSPREDRLHGHIHLDCKNCASVSTLSFSPDGLALLASTRSPKTGVIQLYLWRFPFLECNELLSCRYPVPLYESEDSGVSAVLFKSGTDREDDTVCITTWTQSGTPILVNPRTGHKTDIKSDPSSGGAGKLGTRIQCAAFSPSSGQLAVVNNKGNLYLISYQSTPMEIRRLCASKDLPAKTTSFGMNFITEHGDDYVVLAWADAAKKAGWVKKVPVIPQLNPANRLDEVIELAQYPMGTTITGADLAGSFSLSGTSLSTTNSNSQPAELPVQGQVQMATELEAAEPAPPMSPTNFDAPVKKTATKIPGFS